MNPDRISRRFVYFHLANPKTWEAYEQEMLRLIDSGMEKGGVKAVIETMRWHRGNTSDFDNNFAPYYSRLFREAHPQYSNFFDYKQSQADRIGYAALLAGDGDGALNWKDPQFSFDFDEEGTA